MAQLLDTQTGEVLEVASGEEFVRALQTGRFQVNANDSVILDDLSGSPPRTVPIADALPEISSGKVRVRTLEEETERQHQAELQSTSAGFEAFGRSAASAGTFGLVDALASDEYKARSAELEQFRPGPSLAGELLGTLGGLAATGIGGAATKVGTKAAAAAGRAGLGATARAGVKAATIAALEEGYYTVGREIRDAALYNEEVTVESFAGELLKNAALGAVVAGPLGAAAGKFATKRTSRGNGPISHALDNWANKTWPDQTRGKGIRGLSDNYLRRWLRQYKPAATQFEEQLPAEMQERVLNIMRTNDLPTLGVEKSIQLTEDMQEVTGHEIGRIRDAIDLAAKGDQAFKVDIEGAVDDFANGAYDEWLKNPTPNAEKIKVAKGLMRELDGKGRISLREAQDLIKVYRDKAEFSKMDRSVLTPADTDAQQVYRLLHKHLTNVADEVTERGVAAFGIPQSVPWQELKDQYRAFTYLNQQVRDLRPRTVGTALVDEQSSGIAGQMLLGGLLSGNPLVGLGLYAGTGLMRRVNRAVSEGEVFYRIDRARMRQAAKVAAKAPEAQGRWRNALGRLLKDQTKENVLPAVMSVVRENFGEESERGREIQKNFQAAKNFVEYIAARPDLASDVTKDDKELADHYPTLPIQAADAMQNMARDLVARLPVPLQSQPYLFSAKVLPTDMEMQDFLDFFAGAVDPESVIENPTPKGVEALSLYHPKQIEDFRFGLMERLSEMAAAGKVPDYATRMKLQLLSGLTLDPSTEPGFIDDIQKMHAEREEAQVQQGSTPSAAKSSIVKNDLTSGERLATRY